jgi:hypothetical protein
VTEFEMDQIKKMAADAQRLRALLKRVEWGGLDDCSYPVCPVCQGNDPAYVGRGIPEEDRHRTGHKPGCELAAALG